MGEPSAFKTRCGSADIELTVVTRDGSGRGAIDTVVISAKNDKNNATISFEGEDGGNEDFAIACVKSEFGLVVLFQLRCSGNACPDDDGYGIIRTDSLQLTLSPIKQYASNKARAAELLGSKPPVLFGNSIAVFKSW